MKVLIDFIFRFAKKGLNEEQSIEMFKRSVKLAVEARDSFWAEQSAKKDNKRMKPLGSNRVIHIYLHLLLVAASIGCYGNTKHSEAMFTLY
jgi:S-methylmethionine-dependent homocysteine/selenocysteine methylase